MAQTKRKSIPAWRKVAVACCAAYFIAVWALPIFMLPFVNVLPYVHHSDFYQRLSISFGASVLVLCTGFAASPWKQFSRGYLSTTFAGSLLNKLKELSALLLGISMFTYMSAELSPNLFGALARVLPANAYEEIVEVENVKFEGSKYKSVSLTLRSRHDESTLYLVFSKRLFEYPKFKSGDILRLFGKQTALGVYVTDFKLEN